MVKYPGARNSGVVLLSIPVPKGTREGIRCQNMKIVTIKQNCLREDIDFNRRVPPIRGDPIGKELRRQVHRPLPPFVFIYLADFSH